MIWGWTLPCQKFDSPIWVTCAVKVAFSLGDNRSFKSNMLCSSDEPFCTWLGRGVLIIDHNLSLIRNLKQSECCFYKCSIDYCGKWAKRLLINKDIHLCCLFDGHIMQFIWCLVGLTMRQTSLCLRGRFFVLFTYKMIFSVEIGPQGSHNYNVL